MNGELWLAFLSVMLHDSAGTDSDPEFGTEDPILLQHAKEAEAVEELSDAEPEKFAACTRFRGRLKMLAKYLVHITTSAVDRAIVLALALAVIGVAKYFAHSCGVK